MPCATILYAEDHAAVRSALKETLEHEGWRVGADALLRKPEDMRDIARTLERLLKQTREARAALTLS